MPQTDGKRVCALLAYDAAFVKRVQFSPSIFIDISVGFVCGIHKQCHLIVKEVQGMGKFRWIRKGL